jgi:hypothetical protein
MSDVSEAHPGRSVLPRLGALTLTLIGSRGEATNHRGHAPRPALQPTLDVGPRRHCLLLIAFLAPPQPSRGFYSSVTEA